MDSIPLSTTSSATAITFTTEIFVPFLLHSRRSRNLSFAKNPRQISVFASKDEPPKFDRWDQMELKFGRILGEDPKLTLAKIMVRKSNPEMTYLEIEKSFDKKGRKSLNYEIEEIPFDMSEETKPANSMNGLNLVRPVPKKGVKFEANEKSAEREENQPTQQVVKAVGNSPGSVPNVILRKPSLSTDAGTERSSRITIRPNLSLKMGKESQKERFSDITLLRKPEPKQFNPDLNGENHHSGDSQAEVVDDGHRMKNISVASEKMKSITLLGKPEPLYPNLTNDQSSEFSRHHNQSCDVNTVPGYSLNYTDVSTEIMNTEKGDLHQSLESGDIDALQVDESVKGLQPSGLWSSGINSASDAPSATELAETNPGISADAALLGRPIRLDQSVKATSNVSGDDMVAPNCETYADDLELENSLTPAIKEHEENDWTRAENLVNSGGRAEVEVISSSTRGFAVSFGSLFGFLPYRNLAAKWKFLAFESWLRRRGLDPSKYKQNLGVIGSFETANMLPSSDPSLDPESDHKFDGDVSPDLKLEDLLRIYDQEKLKFLSSFVGQKIKVIVVLADRRSRRLIFSIKPKEKEELVEKKRTLMGKLSVGDVVKCCIKKITYFGIFGEIEGVPALIHQTEVSWDATLDHPAAYFKVGQIVDAKVHQLDISLERIFLSLKEIMPDPLIGALEAVVGDQHALDGRLEAAQADAEWAEVESLIKELQLVEGIQSVSKGLYFLSPGLAPTFQVYMASVFENHYKLLARSGNRAQEVIVASSLGKEEVKSAILSCTNRVQ